MINEEARERLDIIITKHEIDDENVTITNEQDYEAMREAIKVLEQQTCGDAVSRQALLDEAFEVDTKEYGRIDVVGVDAIVALPPVNPQHTEAEIQKMQELEQAEIQKAYELGKAEEPKTGHWKEYNKPYDIDGTYYCYCDNCGGDAHEKTDFCPNCGCAMKGESE